MVITTRLAQFDAEAGGRVTVDRAVARRQLDDRLGLTGCLGLPVPVREPDDGPVITDVEVPLSERQAERAVHVG